VETGEVCVVLVVAVVAVGIAVASSSARTPYSQADSRELPPHFSSGRPVQV